MTYWLCIPTVLKPSNLLKNGAERNKFNNSLLSNQHHNGSSDNTTSSKYTLPHANIQYCIYFICRHHTTIGYIGPCANKHLPFTFLVSRTIFSTTTNPCNYQRPRRHKKKLVTSLPATRPPTPANPIPDWANENPDKNFKQNSPSANKQESPHLYIAYPNQHLTTH